MKKIIVNFVFAACLLTGHLIQAQDNPVSYFQLTPLEVNPANAGNFYGTARIGAYQRLQWLGVDGGKVTNLFIDAPLPLKFLGKKNWLGMGFNLLSDKVGNIGYGPKGGAVGLTFNRLLGKKGASSFSVGLQYENGTIGIDELKIDELKEGGELSGGSPSDSKEGYRGKSTSFSNFNLGVVYKSKLDKKSSLNLGLAINNILKPTIALADTTASDNKEKLGRNISGSFEYSRQINKKMKFEPGMYFEAQGKSFRAVVHGKVAYLFDAKKGIVLNGGIGYQHQSNVHFLVGADIKDLNVGLSFGIPFAGAQSVASFQNTVELGVNYIIKYYKKPKVKPVIFCPRL